jgi:hypothetical protein
VSAALLKDRVLSGNYHRLFSVKYTGLRSTGHPFRYIADHISGCGAKFLQKWSWCFTKTGELKA